MTTTIHVDVVSADESIFSGEAKFVALPGESGELGILPRHTPLITRIRPGAVRIERADNGQEEFVFVAGGILEVQPHSVTVLADTAIRGHDLDEAKANEASDKAEREKVEKINQADSLIFQTEKQLKEYGEKISADKKTPIESALEKLKEAHKAQDLAAIDSAMADMNTAWTAASEEIYKATQEAGAQNGASGAEQASGGGENVTDAEFEEVK